MIWFLGKDLAEFGIEGFVGFEEIREERGSMGGEIGDEVCMLDWYGREGGRSVRGSHGGWDLSCKRRRGRSRSGKRRTMSKDTIANTFGMVEMKSAVTDSHERQRGRAARKGDSRVWRVP